MDQIFLPPGIPVVSPDPNRLIKIVCHRGANEYAPENTYACAQICIDWGMDYVEIDVNTSKDGVLHLFHGPSVERTTNGVGLFHDLTAAQIEQLDAGSWYSEGYAHTRIPQLEPFLDRIKGKAKIFFDVKRAECQPLIDLIYKMGLQDDCFFWAKDEKWTLHLRKLAPDLPVKINVSNIDDVRLAYAQFRADIVEVSLDNVTQDLLDSCREWKIKVMVYEKEKDRRAFGQILEWGVDMINLNHGDVFATVAKEWAINKG